MVGTQDLGLDLKNQMIVFLSSRLSIFGQGTRKNEDDFGQDWIFSKGKEIWSKFPSNGFMTLGLS